jgi:hypothetical protein
MTRKKQTDRYCSLIEFEQEHNQYAIGALNHYYHALFEESLIDPSFYAKKIAS